MMLTVLAGDSGHLRDAFNRDADRARLLVLTSPT